MEGKAEDMAYVQYFQMEVWDRVKFRMVRFSSKWSGALDHVSTLRPDFSGVALMSAAVLKFRDGRWRMGGSLRSWGVAMEIAPNQDFSSPNFFSLTPTSRHGAWMPLTGESGPVF